MLDVTLDLPLDLKRICQANAKVYFTDRKQFGTVTMFADTVNVKMDQGKSSSTESFSRQDFIDKITNDMIVSKSRVVIPEGDSGSVKIRPRIIKSEPEFQSMDPKQFAPLSRQTSPLPLNLTMPEPTLLKAYIDEKTGKFSRTLQAGMIEIEYRKVTRKVHLELDSAQLQKLKELGIIVDE